MRKKTAIVNMKLRMREPLRRAIEMAAKSRGISMNAETVSRLEQSFRDDRVLAAIARLERKPEVKS